MLGQESGCRTLAVFKGAGLALPRGETRTLRISREACGTRRCLSRLRAGLLLHANLVGKLDELPEVKPLLFTHQPAVRAREINGNKSLGGQRRTYNQLRLLVLGQWFRHSSPS